MPLTDSGATLQTFEISFCGWGLEPEVHLPLNSQSSLHISLYVIYLPLLCALFIYLSPLHYKSWRSCRQRLSLKTLQDTAYCLSQRYALSYAVVFRFLHNILIGQTARGVNLLKQNPVQIVTSINFLEWNSFVLFLLKKEDRLWETPPHHHPSLLKFVLFTFKHL